MAEYVDISRIDDWDNLSIIDDDGYAKYVDDVGELPRADVVEREKIDKAIEVIKQEIQNGTIKIMSGNEKLFSILENIGE